MGNVLCAVASLDKLVGPSGNLAGMETMRGAYNVIPGHSISHEAVTASERYCKRIMPVEQLLKPTTS